MHEKTVDLQETPTNLQDLLSLVRTGTEIILTEGATPLARVVPIPSSSMPRVAGLHAGRSGSAMISMKSNAVSCAWALREASFLGENK